MEQDLKTLTRFLTEQGASDVDHSNRTYMAHLVNVYRLMQDEGCTEELCRAGMFHSIYGTQLFQAFSLPLERRGDVRALIGDRAERLAYLNCVMDRATLDRAAETEGPYRVRDRIAETDVDLSREDFDDLCRIHLYDWLEQVPRSRHGWDYRRAAYRRLAERLGPKARAAYERTFAAEPVPSP
jgi:hypothetical protein